MSGGLAKRLWEFSVSVLALNARPGLVLSLFVNLAVKHLSSVFRGPYHFSSAKIRVGTILWGKHLWFLTQKNISKLAGTTLQK